MTQTYDDCLPNHSWHRRLQLFHFVDRVMRFSIVIPVYNRERLIKRSLNSCLRQLFPDFEVVVINDGSTDQTGQVARDFKDSRIVVIDNDTNQERLISRNRGANVAQGEWIVWFDSDDELLPNALAIIDRRIRELDNETLGLRFMCRLDSGVVSPAAPYREEVWDYAGYLAWMEAHYHALSETLPVVHQSTTKNVLYSYDSVFTGETSYHLNFAKRYKTKSCTDVVRLYHGDSENNSFRPNIGRMIEAAGPFAARIEETLAIHGSALRSFAPRTFRRLHTGLLTQLLLANERRKALRVFWEIAETRPLALKSWAILCIGLLSARMLARLKSHRGRVAAAAILKKRRTNLAG